MTDLLAAWEEWDDQCSRRSKPNTGLPTQEVTNRLYDAQRDLAARLRVSVSDLHEWLVALRTGGWSRREAVEAVTHMADRKPGEAA